MLSEDEIKELVKDFVTYVDNEPFEPYLAIVYGFCSDECDVTRFARAIERHIESSQNKRQE